ncbi:DUF4369 domain-containing protein [Flavobacterium selenitireducens]|uniref:DUF4369 domain-containing protein n=1 Tax=Flavobacterium selenitireducens TaxID=2722704 RepID=UPI00168B5DCF|nr:DUF4369 domain-containing protein [Flavobacterium selenitireducens]MBD3582407.1 DUF4369 domain-containing protein [Flavobacterium selenitireducens]
MKKTFAALAGLVLLASCANEEKKGNLEISGNIKGLKKGTLYLKQLQDTLLVDIDTIAIDGDSNFKTAVNIAEPEMLYLFLDRGKTASVDNSLPFFAEPGKMVIDTDLETYYAKAKITGSENHKFLEEYNKVKSRYVNQELEIKVKDMEASIRNITLPETEIAKYENILKKRYLYTANFALTHKDHEIAPYLVIAETPNLGLGFMKQIIDAMSPKVAQSKYGKLLKQLYDERLKTEMPVASN